MPTPTSPSRRKLMLAGVASAATATALTPAASAQPNPPQEFAGKTAYITGAARGIGLACADSLARRGANIVLFDIAKQIPEVPYPLATARDLASAKRQIESHGVGCLAISGDVRDLPAQQQAITRAMQTFGSLDFVIANAGITQIGAIEEFSEDELSLVIDINLKGVIKTVQAATPILRDQNRGRIVLMASVTGRAGSAQFPVYSATKWGVIGIAKSTALALAGHNVTCNALCPTLVDTKLLDNEYILSRISPDGQPITFAQFDEFAKTLHQLPIGFYPPSHVGEAAAFCCSEASALISGDVFDIGAGANARFPA